MQKQQESRFFLALFFYPNAWEQSELDKLANIYDGTHQTPKYVNDGVMFLSVENIMTLSSNKYISIKNFNDGFKVFPQKGDILMTRIGDIGTANIVLSNEKKAFYVSLALIKPKKINSYFLKESIHSPFVKKDLWHRTLHIAFPKKIYKNEIDKLLISYPNENEQKRIGGFFSYIDKLITLHQR